MHVPPLHPRKRLPYFLLACLVGRAFCGIRSASAADSGGISTSTANWSMFGHGPQRANTNPQEHTIGSSNVSHLVLDWKVEPSTSSGFIESSPAVVNGILYVCAASQLHAYNATTGQKLWDATAGGVTESSSPAVSNGIVYVAPGIADGNLYAFNAKTGARLWVASSGGTNPTDASPVVVNGLVYENWGNDRLIAFNAQTGKRVWTVISTDGMDASPTVSQGILYQGTIDGKLFAFNASTGKKLWVDTIPDGNGIYSTPAVVNGTLYVNTGLVVYNNTPMLYAFNAKTGATIWHTDKNVPNGQPYTLLSVAHGMLYVSSGDVAAFNAQTGAYLWTTKTGGLATYPSSSPTAVNNVVYVGSYEGNINAFNATTGAKLWSYTTGSSVFSIPIVVNGILYVGSDDFNLYAFHLPV